MTALYGVNATNWAAVPRVLTDSRQQAGRLRVMCDTYEASAALSGDTIAMGAPIPKGSYIMGFNLWFDSMGSGVTLAIGDGTTYNKYLLDTAVSTAGAVNETDATSTAIDGFGNDSLSADTQIVLTVKGTTASGTIKLMIFYADGSS